MQKQKKNTSETVELNLRSLAINIKIKKQLALTCLEGRFFLCSKTIFPTFGPLYIIGRIYLPMAQRIIYWFRSDLRLNDNEGFYQAAKTGKEIVPVYVFDPRQFVKTRFGFRRAGPMRAQFLIDCVAGLRDRLREKGGDLLIRIGEPEKVISQLAEEFSAEYVYTSKEIAPDETSVESSLSKKLKVSNVDIKLFWMNALMNIADLPFTISKLPKTFAQFYCELEPHFRSAPMFAAPEHVLLPTEYTAGILPSLPMIGIDPHEIPDRSEISVFKNASEKAAVQHLQAFGRSNEQPPSSCHSGDLLMDHGLSKWLSIGCLSPRLILHAMEGHPLSDVVHKALLKRDYFHWTLLKYGPRLFKPSGINHNLQHLWKKDLAEFKKWQNGETSNPEVNTIIQKLNQTGYLTFEERKITAGFLANQMNLNWTWGATYFESQLVDYSVSNSWCNWNYVAGVAGEIATSES
jgi:deoxyribodipyrimidine photo-lyase